MAGLFVTLLAACSPSDVRLGDIPRDGGVREEANDAGPGDAELLDAAISDGGRSDGGALDSGRPSDAGRDASEDVAEAELASGNYTLDFIAATEVVCTDALAGHEVDFQGLGPSDVSFVSGPVVLSTSAPDLTVRGGPIETGFGVTSMRLMLGVVPDQPAGVYLGFTPLSGPGAIGTSKRTGALALDAKSLQSDAFAGIEFADQGDTGSCFVSFPVRVTPR